MTLLSRLSSPIDVGVAVAGIHVVQTGAAVVVSGAVGRIVVVNEAQVVVIELNSNYQQSRRDSEQVFIPDFSEVTNNVGIENVTMIRGNGEIDEVAVDLGTLL